MVERIVEGSQLTAQTQRLLVQPPIDELKKRLPIYHPNLPTLWRCALLSLIMSSLLAAGIK